MAAKKSSADVGFVLLTQPSSLKYSRLVCFLQLVSSRVKRRLYFALDSSLVKEVPAGRLFDFAAEFYVESHRLCRHLDVRLILDGMKGRELLVEAGKRKADAYFVDSWTEATGSLLAGKVPEKFSLPISLQNLAGAAVDSNANEKETSVQSLLKCVSGLGSVACRSQPAVVLGGTFDRLHNCHKILLTCAALLAERQLTCGVTHGHMLDKKCLSELIEPVERRIAAVDDFIEDVDPSLSRKIVPISDPYGPSIVDENLTAIVASFETERGARNVNDRRRERNLTQLDVFTMDIIKDEDSGRGDHSKVSSSKVRKQMLGELLKLPEVNLSRRPYVIGMTGGIASGKTNICRYLLELGADTIDCDHLAHEVYLPGTKAYNSIVDAFGLAVVDNEIGKPVNRTVLGTIVFDNPERRQELEKIVWQELALLVQERIANSRRQVVVVDAAVLLEAKWDNMVHEVWASVVPKEEAVLRLSSRNQLSAVQTEKRISAQMSNWERVDKANVVFCSLWEYEYTRAQVKKAWDGLAARLDKTEADTSTS